MFNGIAPTYDRLNHILSLGIDRCWRRRFVALIGLDSPCELLDVATGTADVAIAAARADRNLHVTAIDLSEEMIEQASRKIFAARLEQQIELQVGDAEALPTDDNRYDVVSVAFGVRNFDDMAAFMNEAHRTLRSGGRLLILEFSMPRSKFFASLYRFYSKRVIPALGALVSHDRAAYTYLPESIAAFAASVDLTAAMCSAGFGHCTAQPLSCGIATIHTGVKL